MFFNNQLTEEQQEIILLKQQEIPCKNKTKQLENERSELESKIAKLKAEIKKRNERNSLQKAVTYAFDSNVQNEENERSENDIRDEKITDLPIFKLPPSDENLTFINRLPKRNDKIQQKEDQEVQSLLKISDQDMRKVKYFTKRRGAHQNNELFKSAGTRFVLSKSGIGFNRVQLVKDPVLKAYKGRHRHTTCNICDVSSQPVKLKNNFNNKSRKALKHRLKRSLDLINSSKQSIQKSLFEIKETIPIHELKASLFLKRYGARHLNEILHRIENSKALSVLRTWIERVEEIKVAEQRFRYCQAQASVRFKRVYNELLRKRTLDSLLFWNTVVQNLIMIELNTYKIFKATIIQCSVRKYQAIVYTTQLRAKIETKNQQIAVTKIQSWLRALTQRRFYLLMLEMHRRQNAILCLQRNFKVLLVGVKIRKCLTHLKQEFKAAITIQKKYRQRQAKLFVNLKLLMKQNFHAVKIQGLFRRNRAVKCFKRLIGETFRRDQVIKIQSVYRAYMKRKYYRKMLIEALKLKKRSVISATTIQKVYRGYEGRKVYNALLHQKHLIFKAEEKKIIFIQSIVRGKLQRIHFQKIKAKLMKEFILLARDWIEIYDHPRHRYLFRNIIDNSIRYKPPLTGYTDINGMLILKNGQSIIDPNIANEKSRLDQLQKCVECEDLPATRHCRECSDLYCNECFVQAHSYGRLRVHTYEWIQDGQQLLNQPLPENIADSNENTSEYSSAWVEMFDEKEKQPFWYNSLTQESTWYNPLIPQEELQDYYSEAKDEDNHQEDDWHQYIDEQSGEPYWFNAKTQESSWTKPTTNNWIEYFDEDSQQPYWYNSDTGESSWIKP